MSERDDLSDRDDPQLGNAPEPEELKSETLHGRNFAGAAFAAEGAGRFHWPDPTDLRCPVPQHLGGIA
jgi:hypothetical protein